MRRFCNRKAVTIIELMAVLVIIGVFIAMVSPDVASYLKERKKKAGSENIKIIREAINSYISDHRLLPKKSTKKLSLLTSAEKEKLFKLKDYTNTDLHLAFPTCLPQLVKDKYLLFIPDNPFTDDCDWEVRGFAESKDNPSSWIKAVPTNGSGEYDGSYVVNDYSPFMPLVTSSALREVDPVTGITAEVVVGAITGIFDIRFGDATDNHHADIDTWDEKEDGKWKYIPDILETVTAFPNEIFLEPGDVVNFLDVIDFVASYTVSPQKSSMAGEFPPDPSIDFTPDPAAGSLSPPDEFTAGLVKGRYVVDVECEETGITANTSFYVDISPPVEFITVSTTEVTILLFQGFNLNDITVMAKFDGIAALEDVSTDSKLKWTVLSGPGSIINNSAFKDTGIIGDVVVQAEFKGKTQSIIIHIISIVESIYATPSSFSIKNGETLNLNSIAVNSVYTDFHEEVITPVWSIFNDSGSKGHIASNVYYAPDTGEMILSIQALYNYNGKIHTTMITVQVLKKLVSINVVPDVIEFKNARVSGGFIDPHLPADIAPPKIMVYGRFSDNTDVILPPTSLVYSKISGSPTSTVSSDGIFDETNPATVDSTLVRVTAIVDGYSAEDTVTINLRHVVTDLELNPNVMKLKNLDSLNLENIGGTITYSDGLTESLVMPDPYLQFIKGSYLVGYFKQSDVMVWNPGLGTFEVQSVMTNTFYADTSEIGNISVVGKYTVDNEEVYDTVQIKVFQKLLDLQATPNSKVILTGQTIDLFSTIQYEAKYSNSSFDHIALTNLSYKLKDDSVNPVLGSMVGSEYHAPSDMSGTQEIIVSYFEDYGGEVSPDTASVTVKVRVKGYVNGLTINPDNHELYTYREDTAETWFDQFNNRYFMDSSPAVIWVDGSNRPTHEIYAVGTVEVYKHHYGVTTFSNAINFDEFAYLIAPMTDGNVRSWGKGVSVGWLDNPEEIVYTIVSGPGTISGRTYIPSTTSTGTVEIRVDYTYEGITVSDTFFAYVLKKPVKMVSDPLVVQMYVEDNYSFNGSLEIHVGFSDGTTDEIKLSDKKIIWRLVPGYFGTYFGNDSLNSPLDPGEDIITIFYTDSLFVFVDSVTLAIIPDYDTGYAKWKNYEAEFVLYNQSKTVLNYALYLTFNPKPDSLKIFKPPYPAENFPTTYDTATHFDFPAHVIRMITSSRLNLWDENILRSVIFFSDGEYAVINTHVRSSWEIINGGGSIINDGDPSHEVKIYLAPNLPETGIHLKSIYFDPELDGSLTDSIEINVVKPMSLTLSPASATINTGDSIEVSQIAPLVVYSDGLTDTAEQYMVVWSKVSGDGDYTYPWFKTENMTDSGSAILRCTYDYGGVILPKDFPVTINVVPPKQVTGITVVDRRYTRIRIAWDDMPNTVSYNIYLDGVLHGTESDPPPADYLISGLDMSEYYTIEVSAINAGGEGPKGVLWTYTKLLDPPDWLWINSKDWNSIRISWDGLSDADGYSIFVNNTLYTSVAGNGTTTTIIRDLNPGVFYSIEVAGYVDIPAKIGSKSETKTTTLNNIPRPSSLTISSISAESLTASWPVVKDSVSNDPAHGYILNIKETSGVWEYTTSQISGTSFAFNNTNLTPEHLNPDTDYTITVKSVWNGTFPTTADFESSLRTNTATTQYYKGSDGEFAFNLNSVKYEKVDISWQTLSEAVKYSIYLDSGSGLAFVTDIAAPVTSYSLTGLDPASDYTCEVRAVSVNNNTIGDTGDSFTTDYEDLNITANTVTAGKIDVSWTSLPEASAYTVYFGVEGAAALIGDTTAVTLMRDGLLPDETYEIIVYAKSVTPKQIGEDTAIIKTDPLLPPVINAPTSITYRTFDISWTDPNGLTGQYYKIFVNGVDVAHDDPATSYSQVAVNWLAPGDNVTVEVGIFYLGAVRGSAQRVFQLNDFNALTILDPTNLAYTTFDIEWSDSNAAPVPFDDYVYKVYINSVHKTDVVYPANVWSEDGTSLLGPGDDVTLEVAIYYMGQNRKTSSKVFNMKNFDPVNLTVSNIDYTTFDIEWTDPNTPSGDDYYVYINGAEVHIEPGAGSGPYIWSEDGTSLLGPGDNVTLEVGIFYMGQVRKLTEKNFVMKNFDPVNINAPTNVTYTTFDIDWSDTNTLPSPIGDYAYKVYLNGVYKADVLDPLTEWSAVDLDGLGPGDDVTLEVVIYYMGQNRKTSSKIFNMENFDPLDNLQVLNIDYTTFEIKWDDNNTLPAPLGDYSYKVFINGVDKADVIPPDEFWSEDGSSGFGPGDPVEIDVAIYYMSSVRQTNEVVINMESLPDVVVNPSPIDISDITDSSFTINWNSLNSENIDGIKIEVDGTLVSSVPKNQDFVTITEKSPGVPLDSGSTYTVSLYTYWGAYNGNIFNETVTLKPKIDKFSINKNYSGYKEWTVWWNAANGAVNYEYILINTDRGRDEDGVTSGTSITEYNFRFYDDEHYTFRLRGSNYHDGNEQWGDWVEVYWYNNGSITY